MAVPVDEAKAREHRERMANQTWYDVDPRLSNFLDMLFGENNDNPDGTASLTLVAQGTVISGQVVSSSKYEESQAASVEEASAELAQSIRLNDKVTNDLQPKRDELNDGLMFLRGFVHFSSASVISGSSRTVLANLRVATKDVTAWSIGAVHQQHNR